jgi:TRAP-type mannitol/chloroaromatic compound transport system permease large subunit
LVNTADLRLARPDLPVLDVIAIFVAGSLSAILFVALGAATFIVAKARQLQPAFNTGVQITSMVFVILIGASLFALVFRALGGDHYVEMLLTSLPGGLWGALFITMAVMFILGFFLDFIEIVFVVVPLVAPPLIIMGADPIWIAILMALNLQTSFLTPPFGFALFYLRGAAPEAVKTLDIWRGAIPFILLQLLIIVLVAFLPELATHLPAMLR